MFSQVRHLARLPLCRTVTNVRVERHAEPTCLPFFPQGRRTLSSLTSAGSMSVFDMRKLDLDTAPSIPLVLVGVNHFDTQPEQVRKLLEELNSAALSHVSDVGVELCPTQLQLLRRAIGVGSSLSSGASSSQEGAGGLDLARLPQGREQVAAVEWAVSRSQTAASDANATCDVRVHALDVRDASATLSEELWRELKSPPHTQTADWNFHRDFVQPEFWRAIAWPYVVLAHKSGLSTRLERLSGRLKLKMPFPACWKEVHTNCAAAGEEGAAAGDVDAPSSFTIPHLDETVQRVVVDERSDHFAEVLLERVLAEENFDFLCEDEAAVAVAFVGQLHVDRVKLKLLAGWLQRHDCPGDSTAELQPHDLPARSSACGPGRGDGSRFGYDEPGLFGRFQEALVKRRILRELRNCL